MYYVYKFFLNDIFLREYGKFFKKGVKTKQRYKTKTDEDTKNSRITYDTPCNHLKFLVFLDFFAKSLIFTLCITANNRRTNGKKKITFLSLSSRHTYFKNLFSPFLLANYPPYLAVFSLI